MQKQKGLFHMLKESLMIDKTNVASPPQLDLISIISSRAHKMLGPTLILLHGVST